MNDIHKKMIDGLEFSNKEFEKETIILFKELFEEEERIENEYERLHPNESHGLDGGCTHDIHVLYQEHWKRFNELKKKYGITDDDLRKK